MDLLRMADVAARLVAWHNRHPLARRIALTDVSGIGVVALPYALREGAAGAGPPAELRPLFGADWMYHPRPKRLLAWLQRHARPTLAATDGWPRRQIDAELPPAHQADSEGLDGRCLRLAITATVASGGHRSRVLVDGGAIGRRAAVFGSRLWHPALTAGAAALAGVATGAALLPLPPLLPLLPNGTGADPAPTRAAPSVAMIATPAADAGSAPEPAGAETVANVEAPAPPADVPVALADGTASLVNIRPTLTEAERRDARVAAQTLRLAGAPASAAPRRVFAIASLPAPTRDAAQAQQVALQGLLAQTATVLPTRLDVMASGRRWRAVWWPHPQRDAAEKLLLQARERGLKVELIDF